MAEREIILGAVLTGVGSGSEELWRDPDVPTNASIAIDWYVKQSREAEAAGFDFVFIVDSQFIDATFPHHHLNRLEPVTLLSAVAARTERIGLAATVSTTYSEPWDIARRLASLDLISDGRAAWNIVTSMDSRTATNFGRPGQERAHGDPGERYRRAAESIEVVRGLWDSYEDDAFSVEKDAERFLDPAKLHALDHHGEFFEVAGPLNISRSRQGQPVLIQAGTSESGRELSARVADVVFSFAGSPAEAEELARDIVGRAVAYGRTREDIRFVPALITTVAETTEDAVAAHRRKLDRLPLERRLAGLQRAFAGAEFTAADLDRRLVDVLADLGDAASSTSAKRISESIEAGRTLREHLDATSSHYAHFVGAADDVAARIEEWVDGGWVDGFNYFVHEPAQWDLFVDQVVPQLVKRGRFRAGYATDTLRGHLGLPFVPNSHAADQPR